MIAQVTAWTEKALARYSDDEDLRLIAMVAGAPVNQAHGLRKHKLRDGRTSNKSPAITAGLF
jgi:hypothetical protein